MGSTFEVPVSRRHHRCDEAAAKGLNRCEAGEAGLGRVQKLVLAATGQWCKQRANDLNAACQSKAVLSLPESAPLACGNHADDLRCEAQAPLAPFTCRCSSAVRTKLCAMASTKLSLAQCVGSSCLLTISSAIGQMMTM